MHFALTLRHYQTLSVHHCAFGSAFETVPNSVNIPLCIWFWLRDITKLCKYTTVHLVLALRPYQTLSIYHCAFGSDFDTLANSVNIQLCIWLWLWDIIKLCKYTTVHLVLNLKHYHTFWYVEHCAFDSDLRHYQTLTNTPLPFIFCISVHWCHYFPLYPPNALYIC